MRIKSHGTGSVLVNAPDERSERPEIGNARSCMAVSSACCSSKRRRLTSSIYKTPLWALCIAPGSTLSWAGVSIPPDWNGSCRTSPSKEPDSVAVASTNGGISFASCFTSSFGILLSSDAPNRPRMNMYPNMSKKPPNNSVIISPVCSVAIISKNPIAAKAISNIFCERSFCCLMASRCSLTILSPLDAGTHLTLGSFSSSSFG